MKSGYFRQDDAGHWYLIPKEKIKRYRALLDELWLSPYEIKDDIANTIIKEFDGYRLSGSIEDYEVTIDG